MATAEAVAREFEERLLADGVGNRLEVVDPLAAPADDDLAPDDFPAARCGEARGVLAAQVVAVRLVHRGERSDDSRAVGIHVGQRRDGRVAAGRS